MPAVTQKMPPTTRTKKTGSQDEDNGYEVFLENLELVNLWLQSCDCSVVRVAYFERIKEAKRRFTFSLRVAKYSDGYFDCEGNFTVSIDGTDKPALSLNCTYGTHFHCAKGSKKEFAERFAQSELKLVLGPYVRQLVTDMTARMAIPPVIVPLAVK